MNIEEIREYCLDKPGVTESLPFNDTALAYKLREQYPEVTQHGTLTWSL